MDLRFLCGVGLAFLLAGCGKNPNLTPPANPANAPVASIPIPPPPPIVEEADTLTLAGPPDQVPITARPVIAAKPPLPTQPATPPAKLELKIDPNSSIDNLSARFATARQEYKQLPIGEFELHELYNTAVSTPFQGKMSVEERIAFLKEWSTAKPEDPTPLIILARLYTTWGWEARGSGFAGTVTDQGFRLFDERLREGLKHAIAAEKLQPADPELYRSLVDLGKGLGAKREHIDRWVETGRKICPNYYPLYEATVEFLLPRWHGEVGDCEKFAESICTAIGGDDGLEAYARIAMQTNCYDHDMLYTSDYDSKKIADGCEIMGKRFPQANYKLHFAALVAWKSQNHALACSYLPQITISKPVLRHWGTERRFEQYVDFCLSKACPDVADEMFWPYLQGTDDLGYLENGQTLVTSPLTQSELVRLWDRTDLKRPTGVIPSFPDKVAEIRSTGKQMMLSAGSSKDSTIVALAIDNPEDPVVFKAPSQELGSALSSDGKTAATKRSNTVVVWDPKTGEILHEFPADESYTRLFFSPDSQRLLISSNKSHRVYDVLEGRILVEFAAQEPVDGRHLSQLGGFVDAETLICNSMSPRGKAAIAKLLTAEKKAIELLRVLPGRHMQIKAISQNLLVLEEHEPNTPITLHLHRLADGKYLRTIRGHYSSISQVLISPDESEIVTSEFRGPVRFWKLGALAAN